MKRSKLLLVSGIIGALYVIYLISYFGIESGVAGVSGAGWPATAGAWLRVGAVSKAGSKVGSAPCNPPLMDWQSPGRLAPWGLRRSDGLRAIGFLGRSAVGRWGA